MPLSIDEPYVLESRDIRWVQELLVNVILAPTEVPYVVEVRFLEAFPINLVVSISRARCFMRVQAIFNYFFEGEFKRFDSPLVFGTKLI